MKRLLLRLSVLRASAPANSSSVGAKARVFADSLGEHLRHVIHP